MRSVLVLLVIGALGLAASLMRAAPVVARGDRSVATPATAPPAPPWTRRWRDDLSPRVPDDTNRMIQRVLTAFGRCSDAAYRPCVAAHDPFQAERMRWLLRQLEKLGAEPSTLDPGTSDACLTVERQFDSLMRHYVPSTGTCIGYWQVRARVLLTRDAAAQATGRDAKVTGAATLAWVRDD